MMMLTLGLAMAAGGSVAEPLVDFAATDTVWRVTAGAYRPEFAAGQLVRTDEGLAVRTDCAKEARSAKWLTLDVPRAAGARTDWTSMCSTMTGRGSTDTSSCVPRAKIRYR